MAELDHTLIAVLAAVWLVGAVGAAVVMTLPNEARSIVLVVLAVLAICLVPVACEAIGPDVNPPSLIEPGEASGYPIVSPSGEVPPFVNHRDRTPRSPNHV